MRQYRVTGCALAQLQKVFARLRREVDMQINDNIALARLQQDLSKQPEVLRSELLTERK